MLADFDDLVADAERMTYGDKEIERVLDLAYQAHKLKGLPYRELFRSKAFGHVKYLVAFQDGLFTITDLDTGAEATR